MSQPVKGLTATHVAATLTNRGRDAVDGTDRNRKRHCESQPLLDNSSREGTVTVKVERLTATSDIGQDVRQLVQRLGGIESFVKAGERVLVKPSLNSPFPFPATTDLGLIRSVVELLREVTDKVTIGDSSGFLHKPTRDAFDGMGITALAREMDVPLIDFDEHGWVPRRDSRAKLLTELHVTDRLEHFDRLVFLPTMRTHAWARITLSLKIGMGMLPVNDRKHMHRNSLEEMIGEMNLYFRPDLVILDGRKALISGGPDHGEERSPGIILASTGRVAVDIEAVRILQQYQANGLDMAAKDVPMIRTARELGID